MNQHPLLFHLVVVVVALDHFGTIRVMTRVLLPGVDPVDESRVVVALALPFAVESNLVVVVVVVAVVVLDQTSLLK